MADTEYEARLKRDAARFENIIIVGFAFFAFVTVISILWNNSLALIGVLGCGIITMMWLNPTNAMCTWDIYRKSKAERKLREKLGYYPCAVCRQKSDIQWRCGHYFCRDCRDAMKPDNTCPLDGIMSR